MPFCACPILSHPFFGTFGRQATPSWEPLLRVQPTARLGLNPRRSAWSSEDGGWLQPWELRPWIPHINVNGHQWSSAHLVLETAGEKGWENSLKFTVSTLHWISFCSTYLSWSHPITLRLNISHGFLVIPPRIFIVTNGRWAASSKNGWFSGSIIFYNLKIYIKPISTS